METNKIKHLEFIHNTITRMSSKTFYLKGWTITLIAALFAFSAKDSDSSLMLITYISTPFFWILDGYYLSNERKFRDLYDEVRLKNESDIDFNMSTQSVKSSKNSWLHSVFSTPKIIFYGSLITITMIIISQIR